MLTLETIKAIARDDFKFTNEIVSDIAEFIRNYKLETDGDLEQVNNSVKDLIAYN